MTPRQPDAPFTYPLVTIDFEASALTFQSFPIEVGIAIAASPTSEIETWSSLIRLEKEWADSDQWDPDAERIHGISRSSLRNATSAAAALTQLNSLVPPDALVWCDGGHYDAYWLGELERAANIAVDFALADVGDAIRDGSGRYAVFVSVLNRTRPPHRAGPDAVRLCDAMRHVANQDCPYPSASSSTLKSIWLSDQSGNVNR